VIGFGSLILNKSCRALGLPIVFGHIPKAEYGSDIANLVREQRGKESPTIPI